LIGHGQVWASVDGAPESLSGVPSFIEDWFKSAQGQPVDIRLESVSRFFVGRPYLGDPLGEGAVGRYDQDPLYRFDGFDCTTFVETMMALAGAHSVSQFEDRQNRIRYTNGVVGFTTRNHFPSLDWIPSVTRSGFAVEVVREVAASDSSVRVEIARAVIDKPNWYRFKKESNLQVKESLTPAERVQRVREWQSEGSAFRPEEASLEYIPFMAFFRDGKPDQERAALIPNGSIVNIVRPNWDLTQIIGTQMNVSHQMLFFRDAEGKPYLRHASTTQKRVIDQDFFESMRSYLGHATARGIHVLRVLPNGD
jgi:hypothetical protein